MKAHTTLPGALVAVAAAVLAWVLLAMSPDVPPVTGRPLVADALSIEPMAVPSLAALSGECAEKMEAARRAVESGYDAPQAVLCVEPGESSQDARLSPCQSTPRSPDSSSSSRPALRCMPRPPPRPAGHSAR